mmetsp:Transcript_9381/g.34764  ORF Transcript_9381/g.34764 Transcript_9381/m.34764 type:complete len:694 (-) Transcript_9381:1941-4022(-)
MKRKRSNADSTSLDCCNATTADMKTAQSTQKRRLDLYENVHVKTHPTHSLLKAEMKNGSKSFLIDLDEPLEQLQWRGHHTNSGSMSIPKSCHHKIAQWQERHIVRVEQHARAHNQPVLSQILGSNHHVLLSQKYEPSKFVDLLTNHDANRDALKWLKSWDDVVFHNDHTSVPRQKILLLAGPAGVGKTTLAHCLANHCNYTIMEINASDDRSRSTLIQHIKARTQSKSVMTPQKPKLVLLDEIDGALSSSSHLSSNQNRSAITELLALARNAKDPLTRPIICTCNDLYSPALKDLRAYAKLIVFRRDMNNDDRIISRLQFICNVEKIPITLNDLHKLTQTYQGDIRSCLNALHFLKLGFSPNFQQHSLSSPSGSSLKDLDRGYFDLMQFIFNHRAHSVRELIMYLGREAGDFKLVDGCFSNYLNQPFSDPDFSKLRQTVDYLCFSDLATTLAQQHSQFTLNNYSLTALIASHLYCRPNTTKFIALQLPMDYFQARKKTREHMQLCQQFRERVVPELFSFYSISDMLLHTLSPLYSILNTAHLRKDISDVYLFSQKEKQILLHLLEVHRALGLTYEYQFVNSRSSSSISNQYTLHPNVFQLLLDLGSDIPERGTTYAIPLCQYVNHGGELAVDHSAEEKDSLSTPVKVTADSPFFAKSKTQHDSPMHNEGPVKFVFEDSASKAIRHPAKISEWY